VIEVAGMDKSYGEKSVLRNANFTIERGDRIALVGANGAGKSTLIRLLANLEPPTAGTIKLGHNVLADYFAQDQYKVLNGEAKMLDDITASAPKIPQTELRGLLGCFLFSGDDAFKKLGVLSGGERNRYALARLLVSPANFLLLDEPTNHLDLRAKDVLLEAIANFTGTVVFVSHDRYFIDGLATKVFEVEGGNVHVYPGNYADYLWRKQGAAATEPAAVEKTAGTLIPSDSPTESAESAARARRLNPIKLKQMRQRNTFVEEEIPRLESSIAHTEAAMGNFVSVAETQRQSQLLDDLRAQHAALLDEWEQLSTTLEEQEALA
jgi:ATP-binding cassette subfamily F protein 3